LSPAGARRQCISAPVITGGVAIQALYGIDKSLWSISDKAEAEKHSYGRFFTGHDNSIEASVWSLGIGRVVPVSRYDKTISELDEVGTDHWDVPGAPSGRALPLGTVQTPAGGQGADAMLP